MDLVHVCVDPTGISFMPVLSGSCMDLIHMCVDPIWI